ncbi:NAD(P)H-hydrate dehydratase [Variovorax sp. J22R133]|uniref:NAD(P)H-hydrate dehydratase n=1 Tax=Variovorax brevis TaxID=3053503 RepID=UPI002577D67F|nr:NAD(P)H-hydrate dehydratase [Variovorax sp. J22R133]MDM0112485.1 NAD(P)H-hydrate dehydratase [Variovorax sp. J22R133]
MRRITTDSTAQLFDVAATRRIEQAAALNLPPHALMRRAGLAVANLAAALAPHARTIWIACGPGNNGGDGFEAAAELQQRGFAPIVTFAGDASRLPADALDALQRAKAAGVSIVDEPPATFDLAIDALLGIGATRTPAGVLAQWLEHMDKGAVLSVDVPSALNADTGASSLALRSSAPRYCLSLLTLKPGLFTAHGRDAAGEVWFEDLTCAPGTERPVAQLNSAPALAERPHASHKGSYGDVAVIGGAPGMSGAALLAASAALHAGAGRVFVGMLDGSRTMLHPLQPELMFRSADALDLADLATVCGCGGGFAVRTVLPRVLSTARRAVFDADALNAIANVGNLQTLLAARGKRGWQTVLTPHPLEAARLLGTGTDSIQKDRLAAANALATRFEAVVVLKGSGSIIAGPNATPAINLTGNARLATAGTGDVLAGMVGAALASGQDALTAARGAVWRHGALADVWPEGRPLTAGALAQS